MKTRIILLLLFVTNITYSQSLDWVIPIGGDSIVYSKNLHTDYNNDVLVTGTFAKSVDFDPSSNEYILNSTGDRDIYLSKYNQKGEFIWANNMGSLEKDEGLIVKTDLEGNIYSSGFFRKNMVLNSNGMEFELNSNGARDFFVTKHNSNGNLIWAKNFGGALNDEAFAFGIDTFGNIIIGGSFYGEVVFDSLNNQATLTSAGSYDAFILKLNTDGEFVWVKSFSGIELVRILGITLDKQGNIFTTGRFDGEVDFDTGSDVFLETTNGSRDIFVCKLNLEGDFLWSKTLGGTGLDQSNSISIDSKDHVTLTGYFQSKVDFNTGVTSDVLYANGPFDIFICKFTTDGAFVWVKQVGGFNVDMAESITIGKSDHIYVTGRFLGKVDFNPGNEEYFLDSEPLTTPNSFCLKLDAIGNFIWAGNIGGREGRAIDVDTKDNIYVTGHFTGNSDFDPSSNVYELEASSNTNGYVIKLNQGIISNTNNSVLNEVKLFPNPNNGKFYLEIGNQNSATTFSLFNAQSKLLLTQEFNSSNFKEVYIKGPAGVYFLKVTNEDQEEIVYKVVKF